MKEEELKALTDVSYRAARIMLPALHLIERDIKGKLGVIAVSARR